MEVTGKECCRLRQEELHVLGCEQEPLNGALPPGVFADGFFAKGENPKQFHP